MVSDTQPLPAGTLPADPTVLQSVGRGQASPITLLTWPALDASGLDVAVTARSGGVSSGPYATLNLSLSVGDDPARVLENRRRLAAAFRASPDDFVFARQVHGAGVREVDETHRGRGAFVLDDAIPDADALVTTTPGVVLAILTADCVPVVLYDPVARVLACVHAGWRGTVAGVCAAALAAMRTLGAHPGDVLAGIGPAVAAARYQVGPDVHRAVTEAFGPAASAFLGPDPSAPGRWRLDVPAANRHALREAGVPDDQIHATPLHTGPLIPAALAAAGPLTPAVAAPPQTANHSAPSTPGHPPSPGYFFSDRAARPCGRLALVARLHPHPMEVTT